MYYLYANLIGEWTCLNLDPNARIDGIHPDLWLKQHPDFLFDTPFVEIFTPVSIIKFILHKSKPLKCRQTNKTRSPYHY